MRRCERKRTHLVVDVHRVLRLLLALALPPALLARLLLARLAHRTPELVALALTLARCRALSAVVLALDLLLPALALPDERRQALPLPLLVLGLLALAPHVRRLLARLERVLARAAGRAAHGRGSGRRLVVVVVGRSGGGVRVGARDVVDGALLALALALGALARADARRRDLDLGGPAALLVAARGGRVGGDAGARDGPDLVLVDAALVVTQRRVLALGGPVAGRRLERAEAARLLLLLVGLAAGSRGRSGRRAAAQSRVRRLGLVVGEAARAAEGEVPDEREPARLLDAADRLLHRVERVVAEVCRRGEARETLQRRLDEAVRVRVEGRRDLLRAGRRADRVSLASSRGSRSGMREGEGRTAMVRPRASASMRRSRIWRSIGLPALGQASSSASSSPACCSSLGAPCAAAAPGPDPDPEPEGAPCASPSPPSCAASLGAHKRTAWAIELLPPAFLRVTVTFSTTPSTASCVTMALRRRSARGLMAWRPCERAGRRRQCVRYMRGGAGEGRRREGGGGPRPREREEGREGRGGRGEGGGRAVKRTKPTHDRPVQLDVRDPLILAAADGLDDARADQGHVRVEVGGRDGRHLEAGPVAACARRALAVLVLDAACRARARAALALELLGLLGRDVRAPRDALLEVAHVHDAVRAAPVVDVGELFDDAERLRDLDEVEHRLGVDAEVLGEAHGRDARRAPARDVLQDRVDDGRDGRDLRARARKRGARERVSLGASGLGPRRSRGERDARAHGCP